MNCRKCGGEFGNANSWRLCLDCYVGYERTIPDHIPKKQHQKYLVKTLLEKWYG